MPYFTIEDMQQLASQRGGKCLSEKYINNHTPLRWQCEKGHIWFSTPDNIKSNGVWCKLCKKLEKKDIHLEHLQQLAKERGGKCLSKKYINNITPLKWQCEKGHIWESSPYNIKEYGMWCAKCKKLEKQINELKLMQLFAKKRGGKCLSKKFVNSTTHLKWQCKKGHIWESSPDNLKYNGAWCPECTTLKKNTFSLKHMHQLAEKYGGKCLSKEYINDYTPLKWQCKKGHIWESRPYNIRNNGTWCLECNKIKENLAFLRSMKKEAEKYGGKCISEKYVNNITPMEWQCKRGHTWKATLQNVKNCGIWCTKCNKIERKADILNNLQTIAENYDGKCLSENYINTKTPLEWKCVKGHIWKTPPFNILNGLWCPECNKKDKRYSRMIILNP
jgi:thiol-disulfide isomerase/thioredoxin